MKVNSDHRSKFSNLSNWKEEAWKNQGFNGIRTRDLRDTGAMLYHHTLGARPIYWVHISRKEWNDVKYTWNNSYIWIAVVDQSEEALFSNVILLDEGKRIILEMATDAIFEEEEIKLLTKAAEGN